ncbi:MAG: hypothetical protein U5J95_03380 [Balneolaceae bacterium]|nr:hypothetical protein [Balneolaceae bacterium]
MLSDAEYLFIEAQAYDKTIKSKTFKIPVKKRKASYTDVRGEDFERLNERYDLPVEVESAEVLLNVKTDHILL